MNNNSVNHKAVFSSKGFVDGIKNNWPVAILFAFPFGVAFGAAAIARGVSPDQAIMMSLLVFAGASQFAVLEIWQHPLPYLSIALVTFSVNARHIILGATLSPWVNILPGKNRFLALLMLSDVNFAESHKAFKSGYRDTARILGGGFGLWACWAAGTMIGSFLGAVTGSLDRFGVDMVMVAFFAAVVTGDLLQHTAKPVKKILPVVAACIVSILTFGILPSGWNIIAGALAGGVCGVLLYDR